MYYVIFDLEWNNVFVKRLRGYMNEIIEVGAVMLDENLRHCGDFSCLVKSQLGRKLNSRVKELTHITNEDLNSEGVSFTRAMERFSQWLSDRDVTFISWGNCDLRSLLDNYIFFFQQDTIPFITKYIDLQNYCQGIVAADSSNQIGLSAAAEVIGIDPEQYHTHRALDDSYLAADCLRACYDEEKMKRYTEVCDAAFYRRLRFKTVPITDLNDPKVDKGLLRCRCDRCGSDMSLYRDWTAASNGFKAVFVCRSCKLFKRCAIRFIDLNGGLDVKISYRTAHELTEADNDSGEK